MYGPCESHHYMPGKNYSLRLTMHHIETVGESDARSQRTPEICQNSAYTCSETASEDSCSVEVYSSRNHCDTSVTSASTLLLSRALLATKLGRNKLRRQLKRELGLVRNIITILETRESDLRTFSMMPELEANVSSSKSACGPTVKQGEYLEDADFTPVHKQSMRQDKPRTNGGMKRALHSNADLQISKQSRFDCGAKRLADLMRQCGTILKKLQTHKYSWVFNQPVDFVALKIPDYPFIVEHPMDLGTIRAKLENHAYILPQEFAADVRLTFANAMKFNPKGHDVHFMADILLKIFEERWETVGKKLKQFNLNGISAARLYEPPVETLVQSSNPLSSVGYSSVVTTSRGLKQSSGNSHGSKSMTFKEKQILCELLEEVPVEKLDQVMAILKRKVPDVKAVDGEVTIELECLDSDSLWELYSLLKHPSVASNETFQESRQKGSGGIQPYLQAVNPSQTCARDVFAKDDDVDIGVDLPAISFVPISIDKDPAVCSSPSSSSSSDSSSSNSDSGDSGGDSDADDSQSCHADFKLCPQKETGGSGGTSEKRVGCLNMKMDDAKRPLSDLDEEISISKTKAPLPEPILSGSTCAQEPQIMEKLHRAAFLKSRFAETILNAREKTFPSAKSNTMDPEKFKQERKELERLQQEEKTRLHAEAKAAENSRKKMEAMAIENARRQREAQRHAARLFLQQMEKTADTDENEEYLKDLELLGNATVVGLSLPHDLSPSHLQEASAIFPIQCSNPLEQLGLFMKKDSEDEQEMLQPSDQEETVLIPNLNEVGALDD